MTVKLMRLKDGSGSPVLWGQWDPFSTPPENLFDLFEGMGLAIPSMPDSSDPGHPNEDLGVGWSAIGGTFEYGRKYNNWEAGYVQRIAAAVSLPAGSWIGIGFSTDPTTTDDLFDDWEEVQP